MILPHPESNLKINILVLGASIIKILNRSPFKGKYVVIDDVLEKFLKEDKDRTLDLFLDTLTFLYCIGNIERKEYKIKLIKREGNSQQIKLFD